MASNRSRFEQLLDKYEPLLKQAFLDAVADIRSRVVLKNLVEALERGDVPAAIDILGIEREAFGKFELAFADAYNAGGIDMADSLILRDPDGQRIVFRFGVRNPEAEAWLAEHSATMVTRIVEDQRQGIRQALTEGMAAGQNPRRTALDVVGRVNRVTKAREGGIIGLTSQQADQLAEVRRILADPAEIRRFFIKDEATGKWRPRYKLTPRRWDGQIVRAINEGRALTAADIAKISTVHSNKLLAYRGEVIGLTETFAALEKARNDAITQAVRSGKVDARFVVKVWRHSGKQHARVQHKQMHGKQVGLFEDFIMPDGTAIPYPHAPGIPADHSISCGCYHEVKIDYTAQLIERRRAA